jgi:hypothetical protein
MTSLIQYYLLYSQYYLHVFLVVADFVVKEENLAEFSW